MNKKYQTVFRSLMKDVEQQLVPAEKAQQHVSGLFFSSFLFPVLSAHKQGTIISHSSSHPCVGEYQLTFCGQACQSMQGATAVCMVCIKQAVARRPPTVWRWCGYGTMRCEAWGTEGLFLPNLYCRLSSSAFG